MYDFQGLKPKIAKYSKQKVRHLFNLFMKKIRLFFGIFYYKKPAVFLTEITFQFHLMDCIDFMKQNSECFN